MVQLTSLPAVEAFKNAQSTQQQIDSLRKVKNSIVGHDQRKELAVKDGILEALIAVIRRHTRPSEQNGAANGHTQLWTEQDEARLHATVILGSIAAGGAPFVHPVIASGAVDCLLHALQLGYAPRLVTATLEALRDLAASWKLSHETNDSIDVLSLNVFTAESTEAFLDILREPTGSGERAKQLPLVCDIVALAAQDDDTKAFLTRSELLDVLAGLLVSFSITNKHIDYRSSASHLLPCPPVSMIPSILSALSSLVSGSAHRAHRFVWSQHIKDMFLNFSPGEGDLRYMMGPRHGMPNANGSLLPPLHIPNSKSVSYNSSSAFPVLGSMSKENGTADRGLSSTEIDHANAVCSWLLYFARALQGPRRLQALRLLAMVNEALENDAEALPQHEFGQKSKDRERQLDVLAVPLAVKLVQDSSESKDVAESRDPEELAKVQEAGCDVLARLVLCNRRLQTAAFDAFAIKYVCSVLRKSFDNVPLAKPMWPARRTPEGEIEKSAACQLGSKGLPLEILHAMRCRRGALEALAAMGQRDDVHRKAIVEAGVIGRMIDSLKPFPHDLQVTIMSNKGQLSAKDGNTISVVLAACHAAKSMARSVSLLRTSLIDAGIAKPLFELLKHENADVQIAATDVCANLVLDFSPMREDLVEMGVVQTLCDHARRGSPPLRLSSLWALKHLMMVAPKDLKINTLEELGPGWLLSAIAGEQGDSGLFPNGGGVSVGMSSSNAAGERVDLLNPSSMDVDEPIRRTPNNGIDDDEEDEEDDDDDEDGEVMYDEPSNTHYQASQMRSTLAPTSAFTTRKHLYTVRDLEENPQLQAKRDDFAIQEQALDFLRNLFHGDDCAEMLDYVFRELGHQKIFDLITSKLSPIPTSQRQSSTAPSSNSNGNIYNPTELVLSVVHLITHIANGSPQHKQLLIAQRPLLQAWLPHFSHTDRRVRVNCVWAVNSLTWIEDENDRTHARRRGHELRSVGIDTAVRALANDADRDVCERVKTAVRQMDSL